MYDAGFRRRKTFRKIIFAVVVHQKANKQEIKKAFERIFEVEVEKVWVQRSLKGEKKAFIKLKPNYKALDVATKLGIV